jgi:sulfite reductase (ferredoxin)
MEHGLSWKEKLGEKIPSALGREIDIFEQQMELRKQGKIDEKVFAETRLRRGIYGQRYDNGQRHDGKRVQKLKLSPEMIKGPDTLWDAPGMMRIKIPFGGVTPEQLETLADLSEEYSDGVAHVTTRQDFQLHYVHIDDTPALMRRLAAVQVTTREACGNSVRNVTACPLAGVCREQVFDVTPYAKATSKFLMGHPDTQDFGRKVKIAFSGCEENPCGLVTMHDMGAIAKTRVVDGKEQRGFAFYAGGGLGSVPYKAKLFDEFLPEEELLPTMQAISRVFARLGEKRNRARARIKFLIANLGIDEFRKLVLEERKKLSADPRWTDYLTSVNEQSEEPLKPGVSLNGHHQRPEGFEAWYATNVYKQKQPGYVAATVTLPLGDASADQLRALADIARRFVKDTMRTTVEQNILFRWVSEADLPEFYQAIKAIGLGAADAATIVDVTACPGTDTCKLGIASSRGLARELRYRLGEKSLELDAAVKNLRIKVSGCFNSCGQHHIADIGFYGINRNVKGFQVPHFQVILGGKFHDNAGEYGVPIGAVPSKRVPEAVSSITEFYVRKREKNERFQEFVGRIGKKAVKDLLEDLTKIPAHEVDPSYYADWGDPREFTLADMGIGECAGEVVSQAEFILAASERELFEAQLLLDSGRPQDAVKAAYLSMVRAAQGLVKDQNPSISDNENQIIGEFTKRFYDTQLFWDKYAGGKFAEYLFKAKEFIGESKTADADRAVQLLQEAQLFIDAAHDCHNKTRSSVQSAVTIEATGAQPGV